MDLMTILPKEQHIRDTFAPAATYYLLNSDLCIIGAVTDGENDAIGKSFFDLYPAKRAAREEAITYVRSYPQNMLLMLCNRVPVLLVGTLTAHTGLVLAILPEDREIKKTLSFPAAFHRVPACVAVGAGAQMRYKAHDEEAFGAAARWLMAVSAPFLHAKNASSDLAASLFSCLTRLSSLLQVSVSADFLGLPALSDTGIHWEFATGVMLATLMAAGKEARDGVRVYAAMEGDPTLYLEYSRTAVSDTAPEFYPLLSCAQRRGAVLDVVIPHADPHCVKVRACLTVAELSAQGVRERHRFLEGASPLCMLAAPYAPSVKFPELSVE